MDGPGQFARCSADKAGLRREEKKGKSFSPCHIRRSEPGRIRVPSVSFAVSNEAKPREVLVQYWKKFGQKAVVAENHFWSTARKNIDGAEFTPLIHI